MSVQYPCGECGLEVREDADAVQCDGHCSNWYHVQITKTQYLELAKSTAPWECLKCRRPDLPALKFSINTIDVFHFDFQQNLPTPKLTVGKQFYLRLLWTYFLEYTVHLLELQQHSCGMRC